MRRRFRPRRCRRPRRSPRTRELRRARTRSCSRDSSGPRRVSASSRPSERAISAVLDAPVPDGVRVEAVEAPPVLRPRCRRCGRSRLGRGVRRDAARRRSRGPARPPRRARASREGALRWGECPERGALARFVRACRERRLVFKATAGLHRAVRSNGDHGFLNLLAAAVFDGEEDAALAETDAAAFTLDAGSFAWRERSASAGELARVRQRALPFDRELQLLRARGGARGARDVAAVKGAVGFGVFSVDGRRAARRVPGERGDPRSLGRRSRHSLRGGDAQSVPRSRPLVVGGHARARRRARERGRRSRPARRRRRRIFRSRSATTSTSTRRSSTRRTWGGSSAPTRSHCCRTGVTFRSATTAVQGRSSSAERRSCVRPVRRRRLQTTRRASARAGVSTSSSSSGSSSGSAARWASRSAPLRSATTSSASCSSTTGARETSRRGSTSRSARSSGKSFATSIAAWVTPLALLEDRFVRAPEQEPEPLPYLRTARRLGARRRARGRALGHASSRGRTRAACTGRCRSSSLMRR